MGKEIGTPARRECRACLLAGTRVRTRQGAGKQARTRQTAGILAQREARRSERIPAGTVWGMAVPDVLRLAVR